MGAGRWQTLRRITLPIIRPGLLSAFLFAFVTSILTPPLDTPLRSAMAAHANLVAYCDRMTCRYFPPRAEGVLSSERGR